MGAPRKATFAQHGHIRVTSSAGQAWFPGGKIHSLQTDENAPLLMTHGQLSQKVHLDECFRRLDAAIHLHSP